MLRTFLKEESYSTDWKCDKCQQNCAYTKTTKIWKIPDVLVLIIKRFNTNGSKNTHPITINKSICFKHGSILHSRNTEKTFVISSFAIHAGGSGGGHYCAICNIDDNIATRNNYNNMVLYDDINICKIEKEKFMNILDNNRDAYMIVYSTID
jgi:ubiquitin C-terminal hydrolase